MGNTPLDDLSQLEQELELELDGAPEPEAAEDDGGELEVFDDNAELEADAGDSALEDDRERTYGDRLASLAARELETEAEVEAAVREVLDDMEREYFFGKLGSLISKGGKALVSKAKGLAKSLPIAKVVQGVTGLARGNLKGLLGSLIASAIPGGAFIGPLLGALSGGGAAAAGAGGGDPFGGLLASLGGGAGLQGLQGLLTGGAEGEVDDPERFERLAEVAQTAYQELARRLTEQALDPVEASRLAHASLEASLRKHAPGRIGVRRHGAGRGHGKATRHITLGPGERLLITRG